ncbi:MAG: hypothetical protein IKY84_00370, partial [Bacteroidaceae bacterium]|nr:hypothetical protein [Bacteroidaceae bacterium]
PHLYLYDLFCIILKYVLCLCSAIGTEFCSGSKLLAATCTYKLFGLFVSAIGAEFSCVFFSARAYPGSIFGFLASAFRAELTRIFFSAGAFPRVCALNLGLLASALITEFSGIFRAAGALPCISRGNSLSG